VNVNVDVNVPVPVPGPEPRRRDRLLAAALFALALAVRLPLVLANPAIFGGDSVLRLARSDQLLIGYWLPLPQLVVFVARALDPDPRWARLAFVVAGALVPVALARAVAAASGLAPAACAGALLALHPLWAYYSLVPYQEGLTALFLLLGAAALARRNEPAAASWLGLACLCRYEAWIAAALAAAWRWRQPRRAAAFLAVPLLWTIAHLGLSPRGSYVLDLDPGALGWSRLLFLLSKIREYSGDVLLVLAAAGAAVAAVRRDRRWGWGALFVLAVVAAAALAGHETPPGSGRISERMAHLPVLALCAAAGLALAAPLGRTAGRVRVLAGAAAVAVVAFLGWRWHAQLRAQVREAASDPSLRLAVQVASYAAGALPAGGRLAVAGPAVDALQVEAYVRKVAASGGDVARARAIAAGFAAHSPDLDRIAAQLPRPPRTVIPAGSAAADLLAVFDDAPRRPDCGDVRARFVAGPRAVRVCAPATQGLKGTE
jgi:hypothetical protein